MAEVRASSHHWLDWAAGFVSGVMVALIVVLALGKPEASRPLSPSPHSILQESPVLITPEPIKPKTKKSDVFVSDWVFWKTVPALVTAYEPGRRSCWPYADGRTSIGKNAWRMTGVAAYPGAIPYGAGVDVPGIGWRVVDDTGAAMKRSWSRGVYHIDVRMRTVWEANKWGRKRLNVRLYKRKATKREERTR